MRTGDREEHLRLLERALAARDAARYRLRLYVSGVTPASRAAIENLRGVCEEKLKGRYDLEVVDIHEMPALAAGEQIVAVPTLVKLLPLPIRHIVGDLSVEERLLIGLDLQVDEPHPAGPDFGV